MHKCCLNIKFFKHIFRENRVFFEILKLKLYTIVLFMMSVEVYDTQSAFRKLQGISKSINFSTAGNVPRFIYEYMFLISCTLTTVNIALVIENNPQSKPIR